MDLQLLEMIQETLGKLENDDIRGAGTILMDMAELIEKSFPRPSDDLVVASERMGDVFDQKTRCEHGFTNEKDCASCILDAAIPR